MHQLTAPETGSALYGRVYQPEMPGTHPGVILLHGVYGIHPDQHAYARMLGEHCYVTLLLDYYGGLGRIPKPDWTTLKTVIHNAIEYLQSLPGVDPDRIGLVGFSQGAFLAVSTAGTAPAVKAVVAYYGGAPSDLDDYLQALPPILLLHGEKDASVPLGRARTLYERLAENGLAVEMHVYPGVRHNFNHAGPYYDAVADADAKRRTLGFLKEYLQKPGI
jgi:carboxymethylenebutenolidase